MDAMRSLRTLAVAALLAVLGGMALGAPLEAHDEDVIAVEARVWQDVRDEGRVFVSARAAGGYWEDLGTVAVPLDGRSASGRYRYGDVALAVPASAGAATTVEVRVWQDVRDGRKVFLSARVAGGSWEDLGTVAAPLDGLSASGRYRYGDAVLLLHLPDHGPFPYDAYDLTGAVATPGAYAFFEAPDDVGPRHHDVRGAAAGRRRAGHLPRRGRYPDLRPHRRGGDARHARLLRRARLRRPLHHDLRGPAPAPPPSCASTRATRTASRAPTSTARWPRATCSSGSRRKNCFVRYRVTDAPAADGTAPYREFAVRPETYAFQSCQSGDLPAEAPPVAFTTAPDLPLDHLGGTQLTGFAVVHGPWQLVPGGVLESSGERAAGTSVLLETVTARPLTSYARGVPHTQAESLGGSKQLPYWRTPAVPDGWDPGRCAQRSRGRRRWLRGLLSRSGGAGGRDHQWIVCVADARVPRRELDG